MSTIADRIHTRLYADLSVTEDELDRQGFTADEIACQRAAFTLGAVTVLLAIRPFLAQDQAAWRDILRQAAQAACRSASLPSLSPTQDPAS